MNTTENNQTIDFRFEPRGKVASRGFVKRDKGQPRPLPRTGSALLWHGSHWPVPCDDSPPRSLMLPRSTILASILYDADGRVSSWDSLPVQLLSESSLTD